MSRDISALPPVQADQRIRYGEHPSQFFDVWDTRGSARRGLAVMIHGGFWRARYDLTHASHLCLALAEAGVTVANLEYRRVGEKGGGWPGSLEDVVLGVESIAEQLGSIPVVLGHSAGGHLALRAASETGSMRGVVALAPVADLQLAHDMNLSNGAVKEFLGVDPSLRPDVLRSACPMHHPISGKTVVVVHGTKDDVVPLQISRNFVSSSRGGAELVEIAGADHFDVIDPESSAWPVVRDKVLNLL